MKWGYDGTDLPSEESFWPSVTDIMMVIVMTFLLVTVAVVLTNTRLLDQLRSSLDAEQQASQLAEFRLQENATLEEQLDYFQQRTSSLEVQLLRSRAAEEELRADLLNTQSEILRLQQREQAQTRSLERSNEQLGSLQQQLESNREENDMLQARNNELAAEVQQLQQSLESETRELRLALQQTEQDLSISRDEAQLQAEQFQALQEQNEQAQQRLFSLEGDYDALDTKYQKLLKPTRSSKGKTVVDVSYSRSGYRVREPGESNYRTLSKSSLDQSLQALKDKHGDDLYVKIIIPENSGLSYNQAWIFTRDTLNRYDYYYQDSADAEGAEDSANDEDN